MVGRLTKGLAGLAKQRKVEVVQGVGTFASPNELSVETNNGGPVTVTFEKAIIAAGSEPVQIPGWPHDDPASSTRRRPPASRNPPNACW